jgi:tetratricopeptide (TPR) repeat protein/DNA-binding XRE family transcriptional regulator
MAVSAPEAAGPVAEFCAGLKRLRRGSGYDLPTLARRLNISRTQLYAILNGEIKRPPDWAKTVEPLVELCANGDNRVVTTWRRRHAVLVEVCEELSRQERLGPVPVKPGTTARKQATAGRVRSGTFQAPHAATAHGQAVPRQLPAHIAHFAGRSGELAALDSLLGQPGAGSHPGTVVIAAVGGTAGIGKTALALHWAHRVADRFPDGQLYVNLRGFDSAGHPVRPAEAIRWLLDALAVPADQIPGNGDSQAGLYRSLLAGKQMLIVLDNARDPAQVRPLLPGAAGCVVLVTSRSQLTGLVVADGARLISLDVLTENEARELLAYRVGVSRIAAERETVTELITLCARLPLALGVAAARAAAQPACSLTALVADLRDEHGRLDALDTGDPASSLRAVFSWSYRQLSDPAARLFRLLGAHPGPDISAPAAASLAGVPASQGRRLLTELSSVSLLTEHSPGRFAFHDLLRTYAADLTRSADSAAERRAATGRLLDHYLHTAHAASLKLNPTRRPVPLAPLLPGAEPEQIADVGQALAWFEAEYRVLIAATGRALEDGFNTHPWQIQWAMSRFLELRGRWHDWASVGQIALTAAQRLGDQMAQASAHQRLGHACGQLGRYEEAYAHLEYALSVYIERGDQAGQALMHNSVATTLNFQGRYAEALARAQHALKCYTIAGDLPGQALALNSIGWFHAVLGDHEAALSACGRALELYCELGSGHEDVANTLDSLGYAHQQAGHYADATTCYQQALDLHREIGSCWGAAEALGHLGDLHHAVGDLAAARAAWEESLTILDDLHHPNMVRIRNKLNDHQNHA